MSSADPLLAVQDEGGDQSDLVTGENVTHSVVTHQCFANGSLMVPIYVNGNDTITNSAEVTFLVNENRQISIVRLTKVKMILLLP